MASFYTPTREAMPRATDYPVMDLRRFSGLSDAAAAVAVYADDFHQREESVTHGDDAVDDHIDLEAQTPPVSTFSPAVLHQDSSGLTSQYQAPSPTPPLFIKTRPSKNPFDHAAKLMERSRAQNPSGANPSTARDSWSFIMSDEPLPTYIESPIAP